MEKASEIAATDGSSKCVPATSRGGAVVDPALELRLIPEFAGTSAESVAEWLEKVDLVCALRDLKRPETLIPLRLSGGAFAVYQQLPSEVKQDFAKLKEALLTSFSLDCFAAYEQFATRRLRSGETVDVFLAELRRLAMHFGGVSEKALICAFVAGLPDAIRHTLRASTRMDALTVDQVLTRARAILADEPLIVAAAKAPMLPLTARQDQPDTQSKSSRVCFECHQPNHLARDCLLRRGRMQRDKAGRGRGERKVTCFRCGLAGHVAAACSGNEDGEEPSAPAFSPNTQ